jgi:hypothetical protein
MQVVKWDSPSVDTASVEETYVEGRKESHAMDVVVLVVNEHIHKYVKQMDDLKKKTSNGQAC